MLNRGTQGTKSNQSNQSNQREADQSNWQNMSAGGSWSPETNGQVTRVLSLDDISMSLESAKTEIYDLTQMLGGHMDTIIGPAPSAGSHGNTTCDSLPNCRLDGIQRLTSSIHSLLAELRVQVNRVQTL